jgi:hypothetical protein
MAAWANDEHLKACSPLASKNQEVLLSYAMENYKIIPSRLEDNLIISVLASFNAV